MNHVIFIGKNTTVMTDQEIFINYISKHYTELQQKYKAYCTLNNYEWDWDIFQDTILKCHDAIQKKGKLNDTSDQGVENYFFISFKLNLKREGQYARNMKRDKNITSDNINDVYEQWYNTHNISALDKIRSDMFKSFATLYVMNLVEDNFPPMDAYLFRLKTLGNMTYKDVQDKTNEKRVRQRIIDIKNWLKENVKKDDVKELFYSIYSELL